MDSVENQAEALASAQALPVSGKVPEDAQIPTSTQGMSSDLDDLASVVRSKMTSSISQIPAAEQQKAEATKTEAIGEANSWEDYQKQLRDIYKTSAPSPLNI